MINFSNFCSAMISGLVERKNDKEYWWKKHYLTPPLTVEIIDIEKKQYILRGYHTNGQKRWEERWKYDHRHGECLRWHDNGQLKVRTNMQHWILQGKCVGSFMRKTEGWDRNGKKLWGNEYDKR